MYIVIAAATVGVVILFTVVLIMIIICVCCIKKRKKLNRLSEFFIMAIDRPNFFDSLNFQTISLTALFASIFLIHFYILVLVH